jgi:energy-converting hydrogenase Eha subunit E
MTALPPSSGAGRPASGIDLLLAAGTMLLAATLGTLLLGQRRKQPVIVVRWVLLAIIGGTLGYLLYLLRVIRPESWGILPDLAWIAPASLVTLVAVCALLPLGVLMRATNAPNRGQS